MLEMSFLTLFVYHIQSLVVMLLLLSCYLFHLLMMCFAKMNQLVNYYCYNYLDNNYRQNKIDYR